MTIRVKSNTEFTLYYTQEHLLLDQKLDYLFKEQKIDTDSYLFKTARYFVQKYPEQFPLITTFLEKTAQFPAPIQHNFHAQFMSVELTPIILKKLIEHAESVSFQQKPQLPAQKNYFISMLESLWQR